MVSTVLLCPPDYYQIEYEINPWMHKENKVDYKRVKEEFESLVDIYKKLGLEVLILPAQPGLPDMVYAANFGFVLNDIFIESNFRFPQRRKEAYFAEEFFSKKGFKVGKFPEEIFFEGQGDFLYDGRFFMGYGKRTMKEAATYLEKILNDEIILLEVINPYFYHLDMCFTPLGKGRVIINPDAFNKRDLELIYKYFKKVILTSKIDNQAMCCNMIIYGDKIVLGKGISKNMKKLLEKEGFEVIETPMGEVRKGGGSVKCMTLEFFKT